MNESIQARRIQVVFVSHVLPPGELGKAFDWQITASPDKLAFEEPVFAFVHAGHKDFVKSWVDWAKASGLRCAVFLSLDPATISSELRRLGEATDRQTQVLRYYALPDPRSQLGKPYEGVVVAKLKELKSYIETRPHFPASDGNWNRLNRHFEVNAGTQLITDVEQTSAAILYLCAGNAGKCDALMGKKIGQDELYRKFKALRAGVSPQISQPWEQRRHSLSHTYLFHGLIEVLEGETVPEERKRQVLRDWPRSIADFRQVLDGARTGTSTRPEVQAAQILARLSERSLLLHCNWSELAPLVQDALANAEPLGDFHQVVDDAAAALTTLSDTIDRINRDGGPPEFVLDAAHAFQDAYEKLATPRGAAHV
jgi:hypothetical protein